MYDPARGPSAGHPPRGTDPVRIVGGGRRIAYWESGIVGAGRRVFERTRPELAAVRADALRAQVLRGRGLGPLSQAPLVEVMRALVAHLTDSGAPKSSVNQYRSNWNKWVPEEVRETRCCDLEWRHWTAIFDGLSRQQASVGTIRSVARTMGTLLKFAVARGYFDDIEPFTTPSRRAATVSEAVTSARKRTDTRRTTVGLAQCPTREEVERFAAALETFYPGYGERLALLAYATGTRIGELLALRVEAVHLTATRATVDVNVQLDRASAWPATKLPKGGHTRTTIVWQAYRHVIESLAEDAVAREGPTAGVLFPPPRPVTDWAQLAGNLARAAAESCGFGWRLHWLRHAWASVSLAPVTAGGYGLDPASVQVWLGHRKMSTTLDYYVNRQHSDEETAYAATVRKPPPAFSVPAGDGSMLGDITAQPVGDASAVPSPQLLLAAALPGAEPAVIERGRGDVG